MRKLMNLIEIVCYVFAVMALIPEGNVANFFILFFIGLVISKIKKLFELK